MGRKVVQFLTAATAMACLCMTVMTSQAATLPISEDFNDDKLHAELEEETSGVWDFSTDSDFDGENEAIPILSEQSRDYIRTVDSDYNTVDFTAEVTMNIGGGGTDEPYQHFGYVGLGDGVPQEDRYDEPTNSVHLVLRPRGQMTVRIHDGDEDNETAGETVGHLVNIGSGRGTHRVRMTKSGNELTFMIDLHWDGNGFTADRSLSVDLSTSKYDHLTASTSRLFMGTGTDSNGDALTSIEDFNAASEPAGLTDRDAPDSAAEDAQDAASYDYNILYVSWGPDPDHVGVFLEPQFSNEVKIYEHYVPQKSIQWALSRARVVVVTDGQYDITWPITIKRSGSRLVIGPKATIRAAGRFPRYSPVVQVNHADHVEVFNLGTLKGKKGAGVEFNGQSGDSPGITGGMLFGTGTVQNVRAGYWLVDTENVQVPLTLTSNPVYAVTGMEGTQNAKVGTVAQLTSDVHNDGSTLDVTMNNKGINVQHVTGPSPDPKTAVVHLNNFRNVTINQVTGVVGTDATNHSLTDVTLYDVPGLMYQLEWDRPLFGFRTAQPKIMENKGFKVKNVNRIRKDVATFSKEVSYPGFPPGPASPPLNVNVTLTAEFKDGSSTELFRNNYEFELAK